MKRINSSFFFPWQAPEALYPLPNTGITLKPLLRAILATLCFLVRHTSLLGIRKISQAIGDLDIKAITLQRGKVIPLNKYFLNFGH